MKILILIQIDANNKYSKKNRRKEEPNLEKICNLRDLKKIVDHRLKTAVGIIRRMSSMEKGIFMVKTESVMRIFLKIKDGVTVTLKAIKSIWKEEQVVIRVKVNF